ncbi:DNA -binding domain-containing protein, partial [Amaricoccus sp.]|uniref:DNA -binding domain-containing protein n=1 Tax=Amaricoccus sp. TaxID=1872485 RepID=UPI002CD30BD4
MTLLARVDGSDSVTVTLDPDSIDIRREADGLLLLRLKTGELLALRPSDLRKPVGILLPLDDRWPARQANAGRLRARLLGLRAPPDPLTLQQRRRIAMALRALDAREAQAGLR